MTDPPAFFDQTEIVRELTFTLADLSEFELAIPEIQSTWEPGGPFRVRLVVTDARGKTHPVVNAPLVATADDWRAELTTTWTPLNEPTGWMRGSLPDTVPQQLTVTGQVTVCTPAGLQEREVKARFHRGDGLVKADEFKSAEQGYKLPRTKDAKVRETRAIWVSTSDIATAEGIDELVNRCRKARVEHDRSVHLRTQRIPGEERPDANRRFGEEGLDPLGYLIEKAHAARLEVHPWFCVTYRDRHFRGWFAEKHGTNVDMIDEDGKTIPLGADVHRPEYRQFVVDLMVGVARDYQRRWHSLGLHPLHGSLFLRFVPEGICRTVWEATHGGDR